MIALVDLGKRTATCAAAGDVVTATSLLVSAFELLYDLSAPVVRHFQRLIAHQLAHDLRVSGHALLDVPCG